MAKILCVLYDDPIGGYPKSYARDGIPKIERYPGGQSAPTPEHIDFKPGELLGSVSGELGLRAFTCGAFPSTKTNTHLFRGKTLGPSPPPARLARRKAHCSQHRRTAEVDGHPDQNREEKHQWESGIS